MCFILPKSISNLLSPVFARLVSREAIKHLLKHFEHFFSIPFIKNLLVLSALLLKVWRRGIV